MNCVELVLPLIRWESVEVALQNFARRHDHFKRSAEFMRDNRNKAASEFAKFLFSAKRFDQLFLGTFALGDIADAPTYEIPSRVRQANQAYLAGKDVAGRISMNPFKSRGGSIQSILNFLLGSHSGGPAIRLHWRA